MIKRLSAASALLMTAGLGACVGLSGGPQGPQPVTPTQQFSIDVQQRPEEIALIPSVAGLSQQQAGALRDVAARWRDAGGDFISVRVPVGGDPRATDTTAQAAAGALVQFGVDPSLVRIEQYDPRETGGRGDVLVGFATYAAVGPRCAETWTQVDATFSARTSGNFGCSITANIAAQVANPRDLLRPREETPADAGRRQTQLGLYRQGQPTGATRSADERTAINQSVGR